MPTDTTRRRLVASAVALAAGTATNLGAIALTRAAEPDPIFAAIAAHRQAWKNLDGCSALDEADTTEADAELDRLWLAHDNARAALINPTTTAGAAALLRYVAEHAKASGSEASWSHRVYLNVADMLEGRVAS
jgi:MoxR-like ATPase